MTRFNQQVFLEKARLLSKKYPLVHCLTNQVVMNFTANILLAIGASPAMVIAQEESADFVKISSALLVNVGTIEKMQEKSIFKAVQSARQNNIPWVLDPVAYGALSYRNDICKKLLEYKPTVIRGNASEIYGLAGFKAEIKGTDSVLSGDLAIDAAKLLAKTYNNIVAVTGKNDYITDGENIYKLSNGVIELTRVTGTGCSLTAMIAAYISVCDNPLQAALMGISHLNIASELANKDTQTHGIGSFAVVLLDYLYSISKTKHTVELLKCTKI